MQEENQTNTPYQNDERIDAPIIATPAQREAYIEELKHEQNLPRGVIFGGIVALICAVIWAWLTVSSERQIGYMAIGVGILVGIAVRKGGNGVEHEFGIAGATLSVLGCLIGNFFAVIGLVAKYEDVSFFEAFSVVGIGGGFEGVIGAFGIMDLFFYGLAAYMGYRFSFRDIKEAEFDAYAATAEPVPVAAESIHEEPIRRP